MATVRQRKAANAMVENGGNAAKAMAEAGYSKSIQRNPQKVTKSQSFLELCDELGLTDNLIVEALVSDIRSKVGDRKSELELASKLRGRLQTKVELEVKDVSKVLDTLETDYEEVSGWARSQVTKQDVAPDAPVQDQE